MALVVQGAAGISCTTPTNAVLTRPSVTTGDLMVVAHVSDADGTLAAMTAPAGWTLLASRTLASSGFLKIWYKVATGSEASTYTFPDSNLGDASAGMVVFRGQDATSPFNAAVSFTDTVTDSTSHPAPTVTGVNGGILLTIHAAATNANPNLARSYTAPSGMTQQVNSNLGGASSWVAMGMNTLALASTAATGVKTATLSAVRRAMCASVVIVPASTGTNAAATTATFGASANDPTLAPGTILGVGPNSTQNHFNVQLSRRGDPDILIKTQEDIRAGYNEDPWFTANSNNSAVQLYAPVDGPTTSGSTSARCELREVFDDGSDMGFDALTGTHTFHGRSKIVHDPPVLPDIVLAQLHNGSSDRVAIRTQLVTGTRRLRIRINGSSATLDAGGLDVQNPYVVGTEIEWKIELTSGTVRVYVDDMVTAKVTSTALVTTGSSSWYFKAGCYIQTTTTSDLASEYGEVELRDLQVAHSSPDTTAPATTGSFDVSAQTPAAGVSSSAPSADLAVSAQNAGGQALVNAATGTVGIAAQDATVTAVAFTNAPASAATLGVGAGSAAGLVSAPDSVPPAVGIAAQNASATSSGSGNAAAAALGVAGLDASVTGSGSAAADVAALGVSAQAASVTSSAFALADSASLGVAAQDAMVGGSGSAFAGTATFGVDALAGTSQTTGNAVAPAVEATTSIAAAQPSSAALTNPGVATGLLAAQDSSAEISAASVTAALGFAAQDASVQVTTGAQTADLGIDAQNITSVFGNLAFAVTATIGVDAVAPGVTIHSQASVAMLLMLAQLPEAHVPALVGAINMLIRVTASIIAADPSRSSVVGSSHTPGIITKGTERKTATITGMGRADG